MEALNTRLAGRENIHWNLIQSEEKVIKSDHRSQSLLPCVARSGSSTRCLLHMKRLLSRPWDNGPLMALDERQEHGTEF